MTETAAYADVILPGVSYAEKEGTFTNTERRVQRVRKAVTIPGNARLDTDIIIDLLTYRHIRLLANGQTEDCQAPLSYPLQVFFPVSKASLLFLFPV